MAEWMNAMTVTVPEGAWDDVSVRKIEVKHDTFEHLRQAMQGRGTHEGTYTALYRGNYLWMSDTDAEKRDHVGAYWRIKDPTTRRVLINGLGLGMIVQAALSFDHVEHVDVVEIDEGVIKLVGPHYAKDPRVSVIHADAFVQATRWPRGTRWDVGWSDIWPDMCSDYLPEMTRLRRAYGQRCRWHDCWARELIIDHKRRYGW